MEAEVLQADLDLSTQPTLLPNGHPYHQKAARWCYKLNFPSCGSFFPSTYIPFLRSIPSVRNQQAPSYLIGEVQDNEGGVGHTGLLEVLAAGVSVVQLLRPVLVSAFGNLDGEKMEQKVVVRRVGTFWRNPPCELSVGHVGYRNI